MRKFLRINSLTNARGGVKATHMPVCAQDFRLFSAQAVIFTPALADQFKTSSILASILPTFAGRFNGDIQAMPVISPNKPISLAEGEVAAIALKIGGAVVTLSSDDKRWKMTASPDRMDSFWESQDADDAMTIRDAC